MFLILASSLSDYLVGLALSKTEGITRRKALLSISLIVNIGMLGFFKYYNFFATELAEALNTIGIQANLTSLQVILPVGISFYTFQTMAYSIDIYRRHIPPHKNIIQYLTFVSFFPQLVAGPIERSRDLLPQFSKARVFNSGLVVDGLRQMLWGFFAKIVIADNIAHLVDPVFGDCENMPFSKLLIAAILFPVQIYADFSGYSNIAIGTAKLLGIHLSTNFSFPLFSRDIGELWRRWHISLGSWCRDYVYIPLGGNRRGKLRQAINALITFALIGLWHGANWTFLVFGVIQAIYFGTLLMVKAAKKRGIVAENTLFPNGRELFQVLATFFLFSASTIIFRSNSLGTSIDYYQALLEFDGWEWGGLLKPVVLAALFMSFEWFTRRYEHAFEMKNWAMPSRWITYWGVLASIIFYGEFSERSFIYFQF